jgi:uncharacterized damage-inducible protein DinB
MTELPRIVAELRRMYDGSPWHGPGIMHALRDVTVQQAAARPLPNVHSIYELTHHIGAWMGEVRSRLEGNAPGDPADGDFPPADAVLTESTWRATLDRLAHRQAELVDAMAAFDERRLDDPVDPSWKKESGRAVTFYAMLHGVVQHNAYHAGQIMILRK